MEPSVVFGNFDFVVLLLLCLVNVFVWKTRRLSKLSPSLIVGWLLLFGLVMPFASAFNEARNYQQCIIMTDPKELLYVSFRFPIWWVIGLMQLLVILFVQIPRGESKADETKLGQRERRQVDRVA